MSHFTLRPETPIGGVDLYGVWYPQVKLSYGPACEEVSEANPLPVAIISGGSGGSSGGLSNTELRASPVPISGTVSVGTVSVTGTFFQATQPVSIAATVAVSGPLTDTQLRASAVPVSGTFYPATQPVSGTITIGNASMPVTGTFWQTTQPVSGTFWQATQPVSIASMPSTPVTGTFWQATQPVSGTVTANISGTVPISIAATVATRDLKDNARTLFSAVTVIGGVAAVSSEALLSLVATRAGVAAGGATSLAVTSGKTLRATGIIAGVRSTGATVLSGRVALRMNPSGSVTATSPIIAILSMTQQAAALAEAGDTCVLPLPDGLEFSGTQQIGLTQVCSGTGGVVYGSIVGFEY